MSHSKLGHSYSSPKPNRYRQVRQLHSLFTFPAGPTGKISITRNRNNDNDADADSDSGGNDEDKSGLK